MHCHEATCSCPTPYATNIYSKVGETRPTSPHMHWHHIRCKLYQHAACAECSLSAYDGRSRHARTLLQFTDRCSAAVAIVVAAAYHRTTRTLRRETRNGNTALEKLPPPPIKNPVSQVGWFRSKLPEPAQKQSSDGAAAASLEAVRQQERANKGLILLKGMSHKTHILQAGKHTALCCIWLQCNTRVCQPNLASINQGRNSVTHGLSSAQRRPCQDVRCCLNLE